MKGNNIFNIWRGMIYSIYVGELYIRYMLGNDIFNICGNYILNIWRGIIYSIYEGEWYIQYM